MTEPPRSGSLAEPIALEEDLLDVAVEAARAAAAELLARWRGPLRVETKSTPTDPVTEADREAERAIREVLAARRPHDAILGEEGGQTGAGALRWVVDPLDGTVNFLYGLPTFAVSVAVQDADGALAAVVLDPVQDELFTATRSGCSSRNGEQLNGGADTSLETALIGTGFAYDPAVRAAQAELAARLIPRARDIRRGGAAAIDMCLCAAGSLDAYYERGIKAWDIAAGTLICDRAGLVVRALAPRDGLPSGVLVGRLGLIDELGRFGL
ncbi:MAG TPA: inositol monophosphatase family protein [Solirubrobacteraceae bacterium]|nr:inositol monophosphatase family protein [Solirubrobacteraceae bacterium]